LLLAVVKVKEIRADQSRSSIPTPCWLWTYQ